VGFKEYVTTRKYGFGRGSRESWAFIAQARGDPNLPDATSWPELRDYLQKAGASPDTLVAARKVWSSYLCQRSRKSARRSPMRCSLSG
jgi:hypothetical protein